MLRCLVGSRFEIAVAQSSLTTGQLNDLLTIVQDFNFFFTGFLVQCNGA